MTSSIPLTITTIINISALADVAQWTECQPVNQRVADSIPSQGTCLGCRPGPQWGACKRQPLSKNNKYFMLEYILIYDIFLHYCHHHHYMSVCVCVCVCVFFSLEGTR